MTARPFTGTPGATPASTATVSTINITAQDVANEIGADLVTATRLFGVAAKMVTEYSPLSPSANKAEAIYRFAGYMFNSENLELTAETFGPKSLEIISNHAPMFRNSGAQAILTRWKRRRGGKV